MDDPLLVRRLERLGDLLCDRQRFINRNRAPSDPIRQRRAVHQFKHQGMNPSSVFQAVDAADVRMIQRGECLRFALEARDALGIRDEHIRQHLDRDVAFQLRVPRAIHLAHPTRADGAEDFIRAEAGSDGQGHVRSGIEF